MKFSELGLSEDLLKGIAELGFDQPTLIQEKAIPELLTNPQDLVALAQTGTGKTAAFGLPLLETIDVSIQRPQVLVLSPTRELCNQIAEDLKSMSKYKRGVNIVSVYGGASIDTQIRTLNRGVNIIVATPGRLNDLIKRRKADLSEVGIVVLDEADEMLNMGFKEELDKILSTTPSTKNTWLFSATMAREVERIASNYMFEPMKIVAGNKNEGAANIEHKCYVVSHRNRYQALKRIVDSKPDIFGVVFCRTKRDTQEVADKLMSEGYNADALHGDLSQAQRDRVMDKFRERKIQILCATDVAARGIDVSDITHVINYELPEDVEGYTHRSGRTARAGKKGESIAIITPKEKYKLSRIERVLKITFAQDEVPDGLEVCKSQLFTIVEQVKEADIHADFSKYETEVLNQFAEISKEDLIKKFLAKDFNRFVSYYSNSRDINESFSSRGGNERSNDRGRDRDRGSRERGGRSDRGDRAPRGDRDRDRAPRGDRSDRGDRGSRDRGESSGFKTVFVNVGTSDDVNVGKLIDFVCSSSDVRGKSIGKIRLNDRFSFVEVEDNVANQVVTGLTDANYEGRQVRAELAKPRT